MLDAAHGVLYTCADGLATRSASHWKGFNQWRGASSQGSTAQEVGY
jgi:hypothetical protein